jgi:hypothetical protein
MIIWILMGFDLFALISLSLSHFEILHSFYILLVSGVYLILKGFLFRDIMSIIDSIAGVYILIVAIFHISVPIFYYLILGWLLYKLLSTSLSSLK